MPGLKLIHISKRGHSRQWFKTERAQDTSGAPFTNMD